MAATVTKPATPARVKTATPTLTPTPTAARQRSRGSSSVAGRSRVMPTSAKLAGHQITIQDGRIRFRGDYQLAWEMDLAGARALHQALGETIAKLERKGGK